MMTSQSQPKAINNDAAASESQVDSTVYFASVHHTQDIAKVMSPLKQHYHDCTRNFSVLQYVSKSPKVELHKTYGKLLLLIRGHKLMDKARWDSSRVEKNRIEEHDIFDVSTMNTLIEGKPGVGKTYLTMHLTQAWMEGLQEYQLKHIELLIFIRPNDVHASFENTIMAALKGSDKERRIMFAFFKQHPKKCCIIVDAIDQMSSNVKVMHELFNMMENKGCYFIVTCRTEHPVLDKRMNLFQSQVQVVGFDEPDVIPFITKCLSTLTDELLAYSRTICEMVSKSPKLIGLCCNPLLACLVCLLIVERHLTAEELSGLTLLKIYDKIEEVILLKENQVVNEKELSELCQFRKLALDSLLTNKYSYSEQELVSFGIEMDSNVLVFLQKDQSASLWSAANVSYFWLHRSFMEFAAALAIHSCPQHVQEVLICHICSRRDLNHVGHFLSHLFQNNEHLLGLVCRATIALQQPLPKNENCEQCTGDAQLNLSNHFQHMDKFRKQDSGSLGIPIKGISDILEPCMCFKKNDCINPQKGLATLHQAVRCLLSSRSPELQSRLAEKVLHSSMPIIWTKPDGGYAHMISVPDTPRFVLAEDERVVSNEIYFSLAHVMDLKSSGALDLECLSADACGQLGRIVLHLSDPEMISTYGWNCPSTSELQEVFDHISDHPKPVLSDMCSFQLMYPSAGDIEPSIRALTPHYMRRLYKRGIRRFIIQGGHVSSDVLIEWLEKLEKEVQIDPAEDFIGSWMCVEEESLNFGPLGEMFSFMWWQEPVTMWVLFYGVSIKLPPSRSGDACKDRLRDTGLLQYPNWVP